MDEIAIDAQRGRAWRQQIAGHREPAVECRVLTEQLLQRTLNGSAIQAGRVTNRDGEIGGLSRCGGREHQRHDGAKDDAVTFYDSGGETKFNPLHRIPSENGSRRFRRFVRRSPCHTSRMGSNNRVPRGQEIVINNGVTV